MRRWEKWATWVGYGLWVVAMVAVVVMASAAQAKEERGKVVVECEAEGLEVYLVENGNTRIVGYCEVIDEFGREGPRRIPGGTTPTQPDAGEAPYPEPEPEPEPYPDMQRDMTWCEYMWSNGFECEE